MIGLVFKVMKAASTFHGVDYNEKKQATGAAQMIHFQNFGFLQEKDIISTQEFKDYFDQFSKGNRRIVNKQFHAILSCKEKEYTHEQLKGYALRLMDKLGYKGNPLLIYQHSDTKNNHLHIVTTRVDSKGKKIADNFEGKRANNILNELLHKSPKLEYGKDVSNALSYKFTTSSQFQLLMEKQGYTCKNADNELIFYKHGNEQGRINKASIDETIALATGNMYGNVPRLRALIYKYKQRYPNELICNKDLLHTSAPKLFSSHLTDFMLKEFGLEFVFFAGRKHDKPYGYSVIDHANHEVYKGGEIMKLDQFLSPAGSFEQFNEKENKEAVLTEAFDSPEIIFEAFAEVDNYYEPFEYEEEVTLLANDLSGLIDELTNKASRANKQSDNPKRRKRPVKL